MNSLPNQEFHTLKGYQLNNDEKITEAMEDYLEMICRHIHKSGFVRVNFLANQLNVRPSSSSKMMNKLKELGLIEAERYGIIIMTPKGMEIGQYLLWRHDVLSRFFCLLNGSDSELQQVEQVEHYINKETVRNLERLCGKMESGFK